MKLRSFNPIESNCGTVLRDAFPQSEALAKEVSWFLSMSPHERASLYSSIDVLAFAENVAHRHRLAPRDPHAEGPAWGVAELRGRQVFCFKQHEIWYGQTMQGVTRMSGWRILAAWSV